MLGMPADILNNARTFRFLSLFERSLIIGISNSFKSPLLERALKNAELNQNFYIISRG